MAITQSTLMVDPSILVSRRGMDWLERDAQGRNQIVVSAAFYNALGDPSASRFLRRLLESADGRFTLQRLRTYLDGVQRFAANEVQLPDSIELVKLLCFWGVHMTTAYLPTNGHTFIRSRG